MAAPVLISSTPVHGATDIEINRTISLQFAENLDASSLGAISLTDLDSSSSVEVSIALNATNNKIAIITPLYFLKENTSFRVIALGQDLSAMEVLKSSDGSPLLISFVVELSTGDNVYKVDSVLEKQAQQLTLEGQLFLPTNVKALGFDFSLEFITPRNHTHGVSTNDIVFRFNRPLLSGLQPGNLIEMETFPILDDPIYLGSSSSFNLDGSITVPDHIVSVSGQELSVTFDTGLPRNLGLRIHLLDAIQSDQGDIYGGDLLYAINTQLFPEGFGTNAVRREIGPGGDDLFDDYIGSLLHKNGVQLWEHTGRKFDLSDLPYSFKSWTLYSTAIDILEDKDYEKFLEAGTQNSWGDRNLRIESLFGRIAMKVASLKKKKEVAFNTLFAGWEFSTAVRSADLANSIPFNRQWYGPNGRYTDPIYKFYQPDFPVGNTYPSRYAKTQNPLLL